MRALVVVTVPLAVIALARPVDAHDTRSVSVDIVEVSPGRGAVGVRSLDRADRVDVRIEGCTTAPVSDAPEASSRRVECRGSLAGARVTVDGLGPIVANAIVLYTLADGRTGSHVVSAAEPSWALPDAQHPVDLAASYVALGVRHIFTGFDHLLFLLSLVLLLRRPRAVLAAETAFTVSHSLSFSAAALGWVHVWPPAAEACIALSLVLVALDIGRARPSTLRASGLALVFGLVHGLGFAGGLREIGLPDHDASIALLGFAAGVELGQVAFLVATLLVVSQLARRLDFARIEPYAAALVGGVACEWLVERWLTCFQAAG